MAQFSHFEFTRIDAAGNPISGATMGIYGQGATIVSGGPNVFVVDDPGSFRVDDACRYLNADGTDGTDTSVRIVTAVTATGITVGAGGFTGTVNNGRLWNTGLNPPIFKDAQGNEAKGTFITDANGYANCWLVKQPVDARSVDGVSPLGTAATHTWFDVTPGGGESARSNIFASGTAVTRRYDTLRALVSGDRFIEYQSAGAVKWYVDLNAGLTARVPAHNVAGALTVDSGGITVTAGGLTVTAGTSALQALTAIGVTNTGAISTTTDLNVRRLLGVNGTAIAVGDIGDLTGWGTGASVASAVGNGTRGRFSITTGTTPSANPSCRFTWPAADGAYNTDRSVMLVRQDNNAPINATWTALRPAVPTTNTIIQFIGTPVDTTVYECGYSIIG